MTGNESATAPFSGVQVRGHLPALDGLRGLAFAMVFVFHFGSRRIEHAGAVWKLYYRLTDLGEHGVEVFFVLSGFLITGILLDTRNQRGRYTRFYGRRVFRIFPLYYAVLFVLFVVLRPLATSWAGYSELLREQGWYWCYLQNWKIAFSGWPRFEAVDHFWSLGVEEQFYLFWPLLVFSVARRRIVQIALAAIVLSPLVRGVVMYGFPSHSLFAGVSTLTRMDSLAMGALLAAVVRDLHGRELVARWATTVTAAAALVVVLMTMRSGAWGEHDVLAHVVGLSVVSVLTMGLIARASVGATGGAVGAVLLSRPLRGLGKISYGAYVYHFPVLLAVGTPVRGVDGSRSRVILRG